MHSNNDESRSALLSVISNNYVGFRRIAIYGDWERGQDPKLEVADSDTLGICLPLSSDAFLEWEDKVSIIGKTL